MAYSKIPVKDIQLKAFSVFGKPCLAAFEIKVKALSSKGHINEGFFSTVQIKFKEA